MDWDAVGQGHDLDWRAWEFLEGSELGGVLSMTVRGGGGGAWISYGDHFGSI